MTRCAWVAVAVSIRPTLTDDRGQSFADDMRVAARFGSAAFLLYEGSKAAERGKHVFI